MAALDLDSFRTRPFRAVLACTVRGVRRVVPLAASTEARVFLCQRIVGLAHSLAGGAEIEPILFTETLNSLEQQNSPESISGTAQPARFAVGHLAHCADSMAHVLMIADQFPHLLARTVEENRPRALGEAQLAFNAAWDASAGERAARFSSDEIAIAVRAFQKDLETLAAVQPVGEDWLGPPFDAGEEGRFGQLWPHGIAPKWYGPSGSQLTIISVEDLDLKQLDTAARPDVVCWFFGNSKGVDWDPIKSTMAAIVEHFASNKVVPPVFVIFARDLDDLSAHQLIAEGATVFRNGVAAQVPANPQELLELTAVMMGRTSAHQQQTDFWQYAQRWLQRSSTPSSTEVVRPTLSWDRTLEIPGSAEQYRSIVNLSQPLAERRKTEGGWPIDI